MNTEQALNYYLPVATATVWFAAFFWSSRSWPNVMVKAVMSVVGLAGLIVTMMHYGYIIKLAAN